MIPLKHRGQVENFLVWNYEPDTFKIVQLKIILLGFGLIKSLAPIFLIFQKSCFWINQSVVVKKEVS